MDKYLSEPSKLIGNIPVAGCQQACTFIKRARNSSLLFSFSLRQLLIQLNTTRDIKVKWLSYPHLKQGLYVQFSSTLISLA